MLRPIGEPAHSQQLPAKAGSLRHPEGTRPEARGNGLDTIGWLTLSPPTAVLPPSAWYLAAMLRAAFRSALRSNPHYRQINTLWERRLVRATCPQQLHVCEVCWGSTPATLQPRSSALYPIKPLSCANDQECILRLVDDRLLAFIPLRMSLRFSSTIVPPVSTD